MKKEWYDITNVDLFVEASRVLVYDAFGEKDQKEDIKDIKMSLDELDDDEKEEINRCLPQQECLAIAEQHLKKYKNKKNQILYRISDKAYMTFIESLNSRLVSNMLHKLSMEGFLESAFDSNLNDFVFWVKEDEENENTDKKS